MILMLAVPYIETLCFRKQYTCNYWIEFTEYFWCETMHSKLSEEPTAHKYCRLIYDSTFDSDPDWGWRNLKKSGKSFLQAATETYGSTEARNIFPCSPSLERKAAELVLRQFIFTSI